MDAALVMMMMLREVEDEAHFFPSSLMQHSAA
jgi:hypothetical protein